MRGRLPGARAAGWPSSSQNICARLPRQKPSSGITGDDCSQPPDGVAVTEPVPLYLLEAAGLRNETPEAFSEAIEEGDDVAPRTMRETLGLFGGGKVKALVSNAQTSGPQTEQVEKAARDHGVAVVPVTETLPSGQDYIGWMAGTIAALGKALS